MTINYRRWLGGAEGGRRGWLGFGAGAIVLAAIVVSCGGTGGGGGSKGNPDEQFVLNSSNSGSLVLNVNPTEVDANKSDRIGLVAQLTDPRGNPIPGIEITFFSDLPDISFLPGRTAAGLGQIGEAVTDANGIADVIAIAGTTPTGTGDIVGTGAIFAQPPRGFGLLAQAAMTLLDVGFIDADVLGVIPTTIDLVEPSPGTPVFFNIVGGTPPYQLKNEVSGLGFASLSQHCAPGCTENGGVLCVGSPCQSDGDCNEGGASSPATCIGPIKRCLASCRGTNCGGSRCDIDADCNDGSPTPANVCKDSGQSILYLVSGEVAGTHSFTVEDSAAGSVTVTVTVSFVCGNGVARGDEQCDLGDLGGQSCASLGFVGGGTLLCSAECTFDTSNCAATTGSPGPGGTPATPGGTATAGTPTPTPTSTPTLSVTPTATSTPVAANLELALLTNGAGDNGNGTLTTVISATVTDTNGNPMPDGTLVTFSMAPPTNGAVINSPSATNSDPPCDVTNFESDTMVMVLNQPGVAHTCVTYPTAQMGTMRTITGTSGAATDTQPFTLPPAPP